MTTNQAASCCLPNEILTNQAGLSWTIETEHHVNCPEAQPHEGNVSMVTS
ncbi:hypothetical protein [Arthrobacter sp. FB24]|nr:hypothetical protein [Arthrobacter sp. FB24]